jgi:periplasmic copper chaperone A
MHCTASDTKAKIPRLAEREIGGLMGRVFGLGFVLIFVGLVTSTWAQSGGAIHVDHAWSRATAGRTGAVYFTVANSGSMDDKLIAATTPAAGKAEFHIDINDNGIMKMRPLVSIDIKAGAQISLKPGGMHLMLVGLKSPLKDGQTFPLSLKFEKAGQVEIVVTVEKAGAMDGGPGMKM